MILGWLLQWIISNYGEPNPLFFIQLKNLAPLCLTREKWIVELFLALGQLWQSAVAEEVDKEKLKRWIVFQNSSFPEDDNTCTKSLQKAVLCLCLLRWISNKRQWWPDRAAQAVLCLRKIYQRTFLRQRSEAKTSLHVFHYFDFSDGSKGPFFHHATRFSDFDQTLSRRHRWPLAKVHTQVWMTYISSSCWLIPHQLSPEVAFAQDIPFNRLHARLLSFCSPQSTYLWPLKNSNCSLNLGYNSKTSTCFIGDFHEI